MKNTKSITWRTLAATGILTAVFSVTACGGQPVPDSVPVQQAPSTTTTAEPAPTSTGPVAKDGTPLTGTHDLKVKGLAENEKGQYLQITISDDDPALVYDPNIVTPQISEKFTAEEITEAQKFAMTFFVEEGLDSTLNDGTNYDEWINRELSNFTPRLHSELTTALKSDVEFINLRGWGKGQKYTYQYDKNSTRILGYILEPMGVIPSLNPVNSESMVFTYNYEVSTAQKNLAGTVFPVNTKGQGKIGVEKDPANPGKWLISEMHTKYESLAATENLNP